MAHNYYQIPGGEDESVRSEMSMLLRNGHDVTLYTRDNDEIQTSGIRNKAKLFFNTTWARDSFNSVAELIRNKKLQLAHFQNTFPLISPSVYYACKRNGVAVVQSLRNYRLICSNGYFLRDGKPCEDCMEKFVPWPALVHACYRNSRAQTLAVASMLTYHRAIKTWESQVDMYITLTEFSRSKFIQSGLSPEKILVKPNYIPDPGDGQPGGKYAVFVGRLSTEKGINILLQAWKQIPSIPLKIVGDGPLAESSQQFIDDNGLNITLLGRLPNEHATDVIKESAFLIFPSILYETFGRTIVEAFACGKSVIASRLGTAVELIQDGLTGLLFTPGDSADLAEKVSYLWESLEVSKSMGRNARVRYEEKYTYEKNYEILMDIYSRALGS